MSRLRRSGGEGGGDGGSAVGLGGGGCGEVFAFGGEAGERGLGVGGEGGGVGEIALELGKTRLGGGESGAGARGLGLDLLAGEPRALERGALGGFGVPLGGQEGGEAGGAGACGGGLAGRLGERGAGGVKLGKGGFVGGEGARLLDRQEVRLRGTDRAAEIAIAARLARLALEAGELLLEPGLELVGAGEVGLGRLELELGLVAAGVQAGDAGGLLEQRAALLGPGGDEGGDAALAHHGRGARAAAEIGKQGLDVARAGLLAVDAEGAAAAALDAAADRELGGLVEGGGERRLAGFEGQRHLGEVAGRAGGGAGEDHVLHLAAADGAGARLAHHEAQRIDDVRLAASVRPDDAGQARPDLDHGRLGEALEADQAQARETGGQVGSFSRRRRRSAGRSPRRASPPRAADH